MIAHLTGRVLASGDDWAILEVGGIGFRVWLPYSTRVHLPGHGEVASLHVHTHVREDAILLYGFESEMERELFDSLIEVSGVGPRLALSILSTLTPSELERAVRLADIDALKRISGVGKRTAERLIVELKDRLSAFRGSDLAQGDEEDLTLGAPSPTSVGRLPDGVGEAGRADWVDAKEALIGLGYSGDEADAALHRAAQAVSPSELADAAAWGGAGWWVRQALAQMDPTVKTKRSV